MIICRDSYLWHFNKEGYKKRLQNRSLAVFMSGNSLYILNQQERVVILQSIDYLPFSRSAFSLASTSRSPRLVPAATLLITGVS